VPQVACPNRLLLPWLASLALTATTLPAADVRAADASEESVAAPAVVTSAAAYRMIVDAPSPLKATLERAVGLVRWQAYTAMTEDLLDRLAREAVDETRMAAAAEGWFSAEIDVVVDRDTTPMTVTLKVVPGEPTRITEVDIAVTGPATTDVPRGVDAVTRLKRDWGLPVGSTFTQSAWTAAKDLALSTLVASPYPAAKITHSEALINPPLYSATLTMELASGPAFRFGDIEVTGLSRYPPSLVRNFSTIEAGAPYDEAELVRFVRRLNASGYFASAQAAVETDTTHPEDATIKVAVIEAPTRRLEGGIGYSTDVEFRGNASYRDVNLNGEGLQMLVEGRLETKLQSVSVRFTQPPNEAHWVGTYLAGAVRTDIEGLVTRTAAIGTRWHTIEERNERAVSATYLLDEQQPSGAEWIRSHAVYLEYERFWRRTDNLVSPTSGWMASLQGGGGIPGVSTRGFGRAVGRFVAWVPIDAKNEFQFRAQGGAVLAPSRHDIPSALLFRTGGDTTVRGYAFESLGVQEGDATVPVRYYAVFNGELTHWFRESWGVAAFVDAGNAVDSLTDTHLALGYGVGARVRSPLGPFRVDLAYGQDVHKVRIHLSVGLTF
jgi:translocation and assembly module TamA